MEYKRGSGRVSIKRAREILSKNGNEYTDEQIEKIMDIMELFVDPRIQNR